MNTLLNCKSLVFGYNASKKNATTALVTPFDFDLSSGEVVALLGENGSGKSTFLRTLSGLIEKVSGSVMLDNRPLNEIPVKNRAKFVALARMGGMTCERMTVRDFVNPIMAERKPGILLSRDALKDFAPLSP